MSVESYYRVSLDLGLRKCFSKEITIISAVSLDNHKGCYYYSKLVAQLQQKCVLCNHYRDVEEVWWCLESAKIQLFIQRLIQYNNKEKTSALLAFVREIHRWQPKP